MQNPFQAAAGSNLNDPLAFVKKLWGDMQLPGMVTPTLSVDELDKQIKDLKTVESWLNVNMNMLKGTIQALEVQRATISALKTMGESFAQATAKPDAAPTQPEPNAAWPMHAANKTATTAVREPTVEENEEELEEDVDLEIEAEDVAPPAQNETPAETESKATDKSAMHNPAAWWTVLQDQFKQALSHAMKDEAPASSSASTPASKTTTRTTRQPASKTTSSAKSTASKAKAAGTSKTKVSAAKPKSTAKAPAKTTLSKAKPKAASSTKSRATKL